MEPFTQLAVFFNELTSSNSASEVIHQAASRVHTDVLAASRTAQDLVASSQVPLFYSAVAATIIFGLLSGYAFLFERSFHSAMPSILPIVPSISPAVVPVASSSKTLCSIEPTVISSLPIVSSAIPDFREEDIYDTPCRLVTDVGRPVVSLGRPTFNHRSDVRFHSFVGAEGNKRTVSCYLDVRGGVVVVAVRGARFDGRCSEASGKLRAPRASTRHVY